MANFSYRFSMYNINGETLDKSVTLPVYRHKFKSIELFIYLPACSPVALSCHSAEALNQGDTVDLDALMADLCSIEQELNTISKPNSTSRSHNKGQQRAPGGHSASTKHTGTSGGGSSGGTE